MLGSRTVSGLGLMWLLSAASLAATPPDRSAEEKSPFEVRILLDVGRDELTFLVINRSDLSKRIHMDTLRSFRHAIGHQGELPVQEWSDSGGRFERSPRPGNGPEWAVRLEPRQFVGSRFSVVKQVNRLKEILEKAKAVKYTVEVQVKTPGKRGEPVDGPRLSSTIMIHPETLRTMKEARARIDGRDEAERAFEAEIELDVKRDELTLEVINRSDGPKRIHMSSIDRPSAGWLPFGLRDIKDWQYCGSGGPPSWRWDNDSPDRTVRLEPRQSIGLRFSFVMQDIRLRLGDTRFLNGIEKMLEKADAVKYSMTVHMKTPGKGGEPVDGPRLKSNRLRVDKATVRALKAARARIAREKQ